MRTNTSATLYNRHERDGEVRFYKTTLAAVHWEPRQGANIVTSGLRDADALRVYVPVDVPTGKEYAPPHEYAAMDNPSGHWTLTSGQDYIVAGAAPNAQTEDDIKQLKREREVYKLTTVDSKMFGSRSMRHWEVGAR